MYSLSGVDKEYARGSVTVTAIAAVSLEIGAGEMVSLEGPSGSGKSTLLLLLGALDRPTRGSILYNGVELASASERELTQIRRNEIGFVFQQFNLIPTLSAAENVEIAAQARPGTEASTRARELLEMVGLGSRSDHLPSRLSGGEQQRVAIARALMNGPKVIIADEPTGNLDSASAATVMDLLSKLNSESGVTVIIATHDRDVAGRCPRRIRLRDGKIQPDADE
ncbi:MAG: ABC transporter ATP-binding protein [Actinomycetota bacterium]|nr:ABC transporter ATP-binding protein [Actinomycetota bacterium]